MGRPRRLRGFNRHLNDVARQFPHLTVSDQLWLHTRPRTSASAHLFLKAVELIDRDHHGRRLLSIPYSERLSNRAAWSTRCAFFAEARDISDWNVHQEIAGELGLDYQQVEEKIRSSEAMSLLAVDYTISQTMGVAGSPTFIMNNGRRNCSAISAIGSWKPISRNCCAIRQTSEASWC